MAEELKIDSKWKNNFTPKRPWQSYNFAGRKMDLATQIKNAETKLKFVKIACKVNGEIHGLCDKGCRKKSNYIY